MQSTLDLIYPPICINCDAPTDVNFALCGTCWRNTVFTNGLSTNAFCDLCGDQLPGIDDGHCVVCDACMNHKPVWSKGRSVMSYQGAGRGLILAFKHADRPELARAFVPWLVRAARPLVDKNTLIVPIPIHWSRLLIRRYNQSNELARGLAKALDLEQAPQALIRTKRTRPHKDMDVEQRFANMKGAIIENPKRSNMLQGRNILLLDDVMTSGATFDAAARACHHAGSLSVHVLSLARARHAP